MNSKKLIFSICVAAVCATLGLASGLIQGCKTVSHETYSTTNGVTTTNIVTASELDPYRTSEALRTIIAVVVPFAVEKDTNAVTYLTASALVIKAAAQGGEYDPDVLKKVLSNSGLDALKTPEARAGINAAFGVYRAYFADAVAAKVDKAVWVKPVLDAVWQGIDDALVQPTR